MITKQIDFKTISRQADILALIGNDTQLKRVASTNGGEHAGPCPFCGGTKRFKVQPAIGKWFCSDCTGRTFTNDAIDYVMKRDNVPVYEAAQRIAGNAPLLPIEPIKQETAVATTQQPPDDRWQALAMTAIQESCEYLHSGQPDAVKVLNYLINQRGLTRETIFNASLGFNPTDRKINGFYFFRGITIPNLIGGDIWSIKIRISPRHWVNRKAVENGKDPQKYVCFAGSDPKSLYGANQLAKAQHGVIVEGEFDALLLSQFVGPDTAVGTMGSKGYIPNNPYWRLYLNGLRTLKVSLDADAQDKLDRWQDLLPFAELMPPLPNGANDITDYWSNDGDLKEWLNTD